VIAVGAAGVDVLSNQPVAGELLSERLRRGPLPVEAALRYAVQIGRALQAVHNRAMVHGGVAPENIAVTGSGAALLQPRDVPDGSLAAYRAPEQVQGSLGDWRSDIFSYGAVLYEMAAGRPAFAGQGSALDAAILKHTPAPLPAATPTESVYAAVAASCLAKDPEQRRQRVQNAVIELRLAGRPRVAGSPRHAVQALPEATARDAAPAATVTTTLPSRTEYRLPGGPPPVHMRWRIPAIALATLALAASGVAAAFYLKRPPEPTLRFFVSPPENSYPGTPAVSPDGRSLTFSAVGPEGRRMLWLRDFDAMQAREIPGTEGAFAPFWSPDSQHIAFFAGKGLKQVHLLSNLADVKPETICQTDAQPGGGAWNSDGTIVFAPGMEDGLYQVPAAGGHPQPLLQLDQAKGERAQLWPQFLPDGKHFLFFLLTTMPETTGVYAGALDTPGYRRVLQSETNAVFSPGDGESGSGYLLYIQDRDLMRQKFNASRLEAEGEAKVQAADIGALQTLSLAPVSVSRTGVLVYQSVPKATRQLVWLDREGRQMGFIPDPGQWGPPRISPDGTRVAVGKLGKDQQDGELWILDGAGNETLFESEPHINVGMPVWSPDGTKIAFWRDTGAANEIAVKAADGDGRVESLYRSSFAKFPSDWSHDGRFLLFGEIVPGTRSDIMALAPGERRAAPVVSTIYSESYATVSQDGKWLAYQSDESGSSEVYVQPFEATAGGVKRRWQISRTGGGLPRWRADSVELFYMDAAGTVYAAQVHPAGGDLRPDPPQALFTVRPVPKTWNLFDVSADGQRFIVNEPLEWSNSSLITVTTNWTEKLKS